MFAILMPSNFTMKEGAPLWPGVQLGKFLGAGAQVGAARVLALPNNHFPTTSSFTSACGIQTSGVTTD